MDQSGRINIDLHRTITHPEFPIRIEFEHWRASLRPLSIPGGTIPSLSPEDLMLALCIQVAKDGWVRRCELKKICDIAELVRSHSRFGWQQTIEEANRLGCRRILFLGLLAAHELLDAALPKEVAARIGAEPNMAFLTRHVCQGLFE